MRSISTSLNSSLAVAPGDVSDNRALKPRPSTFLVMSDDLLRQLKIAFGPPRAYVVENNRLTVARRFRKAHVSRNYSFQNLTPVETFEVRRDSRREIRAV